MNDRDCGDGAEELDLEGFGEVLSGFTTWGPMVSGSVSVTLLKQGSSPTMTRKSGIELITWGLFIEALTRFCTYAWAVRHECLLLNGVVTVGVCVLDVC